MKYVGMRIDQIIRFLVPVARILPARLVSRKQVIGHLGSLSPAENYAG
jgi:hypothetical protein